MLYVTRKINLAEFVYKVLYDMAPPVENPFFTRQVAPYDMRDNFKLIKPVYNTVQFGMRSIAYQGPLVWNALPINVKNSTDLMQFKISLISRNVLSTCQCGNCILCKRNSL